MTNNQTLIEKLEAASYHKPGSNTRCLDLDMVLEILRQHKESPVSLEECALALYRSAYPKLSQTNEWTDQERNIYRDDARVVLDYIGREYE